MAKAEIAVSINFIYLKLMYIAYFVQLVYKYNVELIYSM